jgi:uncharacterized membrane protein YedE/YeeE
MRRLLAAFASGGLFGSGLVVSGMTDTTKVQGWLDIFGAWDPTLAFVMGGAILPMALAWRITRRMRSPAFGAAFPAPAEPRLDRGLILGSMLFGMGWALTGLCPGPAIASLSFGGTGGLLFLLAMVIGMLAAPRLRALTTASP